MGAGIILGLPYDTIDYFKEVEDWVLDKDNPLASIEVYPLMLFKKNKGSYGSEFSMNPEIYGYEIDENNYWNLKEQNLNSNIVTHYANKIMSKRYTLNKVSEFQIMTQQNLGIPISELLTTNYIDMETKFNVSSRNIIKLNEYKQRIGL
jgi:hypothetical protein